MSVFGVRGVPILSIHPAVNTPGMYLNRVVAVVSVLISLALAVLPVVANFDWTSTAGVIAGIVAVLGVVSKWLEGWQAHEARQPVPAVAPAEPDQGDAGGLTAASFARTAPKKAKKS